MSERVTVSINHFNAQLTEAHRVLPLKKSMISRFTDKHDAIMLCQVSSLEQREGEDSRKPAHYFIYYDIIRCGVYKRKIAERWSIFITCTHSLMKCFRRWCSCFISQPFTVTKCSHCYGKHKKTLSALKHSFRSSTSTEVRTIKFCWMHKFLYHSMSCIFFCY